MNTGNDLAEFETTGSPASIAALGHDISSATFTAAKGSDSMNMNSLISDYLTPLLQFASKSPKYEDVLVEAY